MTTSRTPGFSAESALNRSSAHYQVSAMLAGIRQGGEGIIHPALPAVGCGYVRLSFKEYPRYCCWAFGYRECSGEILSA